MQLEYLLFDRIKDAIKKKPIRCRVCSGSMLPILKIGEEILLAPLPAEVKPFDIIVFRSERNQQLYAHLVWRIPRPIDGRTIYVTKGYCAVQEDDFIYREDVLGIVTSHRATLLMKFRLVFSFFFNRI